MVTPDWQVTAKTIYCDKVDDDVTIMVYKDWSTKCTGYKKYVEGVTKETLRALKERARKLERELKCEGPLSSLVIEYRDSLMAEEETKARVKS
ncbi:hypothetical protein ACFLYE_02060 [Chloroflexota bacterium]